VTGEPPKKRKKKRKGPPRGPATIRELVPRVYPSHEPEDLRLVRALAWWDRHVPPRIVKNVRPAKLTRGLLVFHAVTSAWAQELTMLLPRFTPGLIAAVPGLDAKMMRVKVGPLPPRPPSPYAKAPPIPPLDIQQLPDAVARALAAIGDDDVRDAVARAAAQSLAPRSRGGS